MADRAKRFKRGGRQALRPPKDSRFEDQQEVLTWSQEFLELAGSAEDFPYPEEPLPADPGPDL